MLNNINKWHLHSFILFSQIGIQIFQDFFLASYPRQYFPLNSPGHVHVCVYLGMYV